MAAKCDWLSVGDPHVPKTRRDKDLTLLTYYCKYRSATTAATAATFNPPEIKIEIFYGNSMEHVTHTDMIKDPIF